MAAGLAVKERPSGTVSPSPQPPPEGAPALSGPGLTIEDSAELQPTRVSPSATGRTGKEAQSARKAKQPSCGCIIS